MEKLVSIVLPVFNVEKYLDRCISSILKQNYSNIELIIVDDGSTDSSSQICDLWEKKDRRISVFHIDNGGVSNARNYGMKYANGDFLMFVDSDDYIDKDLVCKMVYAKDKNNVELCVCGFYHVFSNKRKLVTEKEGHYSKEAYLQLMKKWKLSPLIGSPCNKLFDISIIKNNNIQFLNNTKYAEDYMFNLDYLWNVDSIYFVDDALYYYNMETPGSLTKTNFRDYNQWTDVQYELYKRIKKYENNIEESTELSDEIFIYMSTLNLYERIGNQERQELEKYYNWLLSHDDIFHRCKKIDNLPSMNLKYQILRRDYLKGKMKSSYYIILFLKTLKK